MNEARIKSKSDHEATPAGQAKRWDIELRAAKKNQETWWADGDKCVKEFLGEGQGKRLNLFHADIVTKSAQLYGNIPKVRARRRFADANDDVARVSAEALERLLNTDIEREDDGFREALSNALGDWLKPGLGQVRLRYVVEMEPTPETPAQMGQASCSCMGTVGAGCPDCAGSGMVEHELAPAIPAGERKVFEDVETDHVNWKDFLWSPCRTWAEVRWGAVKAPMTKDEFAARFGEEAAKAISLTRSETKDDDDAVKEVWSRVDVWEIWNKEDREVVWHVEGHPAVLDTKPDPLELPGFFPWPKPLASNVTTTKFLPKPDYLLARDLYDEAHALSERIRALVKTVKVAGICDQASEGVQKLLDDSCENQIIPVKGFAAFIEKGAMAGAMAFLPIEASVKAISELVGQRNLVIVQLHQITGQSDLMRGQAEQRATATEQRIKARFSSTRIQMDQNELARFASDAQRIRASIIAKHFDAETIAERANLTDPKHPDAQFVQPALELLKSAVESYRIEIDAESLAMTDYDAVKQERTEFLQSMTAYLGEVAKIAPMVGPALPHLLELGKHALAGFRGAAALEGVFDKMIEALKAPRPPAPPDPSVQAKQVDAQARMQQTGMDLQRAQAEHGFKMQQLQAEVVADQVHTRNEIARAQVAPRPSPMTDPGAP